MSIHSFVEWLDTFSYVLRSADVTVKEVNHIRCLQLTLHNILYSFPVVLLWNTCACCNWRQHLQRLSPHGLHWPTVDEGLDIAALTRGYNDKAIESGFLKASDINRNDLRDIVHSLDVARGLHHLLR